jgi:hypothetical protein
LPNVGHELKVVRKGRRPDRERIANALEDGRVLAGPPIIVPQRLEHPHSLVLAALDVLSRAKPRNGLVSCQEERCLDIAVSPPLLPRAARIMHALILALEERGCPVDVTEPQKDSSMPTQATATRTFVAGEWIRFGLAERLRQHLPPSTAKPPRRLKGKDLEFWAYWNRPRMVLVPAGALVLVVREPDVGVQVTWGDGGKPVEDRLNDFIKKLFAVAEAKRQTREADSSWLEAFVAEAARKRIAQEQAAAEAHRVTELRDVLARRREARDTRQLIRDARARADACQRLTHGFLEWAERHADAIDPLG